jgi:hypothetical protein
MNMYFNRTASVLTKHGKELVLNEILQPSTGLEIKHTDAYDTDLLGTFTLEAARYGSQLDAARKKAQIGMELVGTDLGLANEGAFVADPHTGILSWNYELVILIDQALELEITGFYNGPAQNAHAYVSHWEELEKFSQIALFPSHHLVIKPTDEYHPESIKNISDIKQLKHAFEWASTHSSKGVVYVENDLRAFANPTRMEGIRQATIDLAKKMNSLCPALIPLSMIRTVLPLPVYPLAQAELALITRSTSSLVLPALIPLAVYSAVLYGDRFNVSALAVSPNVSKSPVTSFDNFMLRLLIVVQILVVV